MNEVEKITEQQLGNYVLGFVNTYTKCPIQIPCQREREVISTVEEIIKESSDLSLSDFAITGNDGSQYQLQLSLVKVA